MREEGELSFLNFPKITRSRDSSALKLCPNYSVACLQFNTKGCVPYPTTKYAELAERECANILIRFDQLRLAVRVTPKYLYSLTLNMEEPSIKYVH